MSHDDHFSDSLVHCDVCGDPAHINGVVIDASGIWVCKGCAQIAVIDYQLTRQDRFELISWIVLFLILIFVMVACIIDKASEAARPQPHLSAKITIQPVPDSYMGEYEIPGAYAEKHKNDLNLQVRSGK